MTGVMAHSRRGTPDLPVDGADVLQIGDLHEGPVEVVQLKDAGQQEEAGDEDAGKEFGQGEGLQADVS